MRGIGMWQAKYGQWLLISACQHLQASSLVALNAIELVTGVAACAITRRQKSGPASCGERSEAGRSRTYGL